MAHLGRCRGPVRIDEPFERRVGKGPRDLVHDLAQIRGPSAIDDWKPTPWGGHSLHRGYHGNTGRYVTIPVASGATGIAESQFAD